MKYLKVIIPCIIMLLLSKSSFGTVNTSIVYFPSINYSVKATELTFVQMQEDYTFFWDMINRNYPFVGVAQRRGTLTDTIYERFSKKITEETTSVEFSTIMFDTARAFGGVGHLGFLESDQEFQMHKEVYEQWDNPLGEYVTALLEASEKKEAYKDSRTTIENKSTEDDSSLSYNVKTEIMTENEIAYLKINSFHQKFEAQDRVIIIDFLEEIKTDGYSHLIIDITGNTGGSSNYWLSSIVNPLLTEKATTTQNLFYRKTAESDYYVSNFAMFQMETHRATESDIYARLNPEDQDYFSHTLIKTETFIPSFEGLEFPGEIWVLVDEHNYSSADSFAIFCKQTGFATLVGTPTRGGGGGLNPFYNILPNSGLVWRQDLLYIVNEDGTCNEEFGTVCFAI